MVVMRAIAALATVSTVASMSIGRGIADMTGMSMMIVDTQEPLLSLLHLPHLGNTPQALRWKST
jgi:hypothetical protein